MSSHFFSAQTELSLDARIRQLLEHFKQDDPKGIPGAPIPDPMTIPDFKGSFSVADINFSEAMLYNMSQFRLNYVRTDLKDLKVSALKTEPSQSKKTI